MTNMEGVGLLFILLIFGVPILFITIGISFYLHRRSLADAGRSQDRETPEEMLPISREMIRMFLHEPDAFFRRLSASRTNLYLPFILILLGGLAYDIGFVLLMEPATLSGGIVNILFLTLAMLPLFVIFILLGWFILAGMLHIFSIFFRGTGPFYTTLQNTGFGMALFLGASGILLAAGAFTLALIRLVPDYATLGYPPDQGPVTVFSIAVNICTLVLSAWYWSHGIVHARKIRFFEAAIAVSCVVILDLLLMCLQPVLMVLGNQ